MTASNGTTLASWLLLWNGLHVNLQNCIWAKREDGQSMRAATKYKIQATLKADLSYLNFWKLFFLIATYQNSHLNLNLLHTEKQSKLLNFTKTHESVDRTPLRPRLNVSRDKLDKSTSQTTMCTVECKVRPKHPRPLCPKCRIHHWPFNLTMVAIRRSGSCASINQTETQWPLKGGQTNALLKQHSVK